MKRLFFQFVTLFVFLITNMSQAYQHKEIKNSIEHIDSDYKINFILANRLYQFKQDIEAHKWEKLINYYTGDHSQGQFMLFFDPKYSQGKNPDNKEHWTQFLKWYLRDALGIRVSKNKLENINQIKTIQYISSIVIGTKIDLIFL